ncbi:MAG: type II toxin-antitoxin system VapC family toxin [Planctomycetota bacterium]
MSFLLDTNICSAFVRRPSRLAHRFDQYSGRLATSSVVLAELYTWAYKRNDPGPLVYSIERELLAELRVLDFCQEDGKRAGRLRGKLLIQGVVVPEVDLMIAAVALEHDLTLVTNNVKHFQPVPGLRVEDWLD